MFRMMYMEAFLSVIDAIVPANGRGMTLLLLFGIAMMVLLFIVIGRLNDKVIAEIELKKKTRYISS